MLLAVALIAVGEVVGTEFVDEVIGGGVVAAASNIALSEMARNICSFLPIVMLGKIASTSRSPISKKIDKSITSFATKVSCAQFKLRSFNQRLKKAGL